MGKNRKEPRLFPMRLFLSHGYPYQNKNDKTGKKNEYAVY